MKRAAQRLQGKPAIELIEEATHLLRAAPLATLASYYLGSLPFVLGLLYFWTDMSRSPFARQHLAEAALALAALFVWMKFWQALFARHLRARITGESPNPRAPNGHAEPGSVICQQVAAPSISFTGCRRIFLAQAALQSTGLFILPLALIPILPFAWVYAFYQNLTVLAATESGDLRMLLRAARKQAGLWSRQNMLLLAILAGFGFYVFLNWTTVCFLLPSLLKMLFGVESIFTRSGLSLLNTTFFAAMFCLTYLCVDPILKAAYVLRCFYGQSLQSGDDLKSEIRMFGAPAAALSILIIGLSCVSGATTGRPLGLPIAAAASSPVQTPEASDPNQNAAETTPRPGRSRAAVSPPALDRAINDVIQQRKYTWRAPREKLEGPEPQKGVLGRFLDRVADMVSRWAKGIGDWLERLLRRLLSGQRQRAPGSSGYGWIMSLELLMYVLVIAVVAALVMLVHRVLRERQLRALPINTEPIQPVPDLADENLAADQLPEDGWTKLARELLERGELRLALRAYYFASLAHLAARNLISLAKFKSNRDYERELVRRGHSFPGLLTSFGENVSVFDRIWYGLHEINRDLVSQFAANVERIKNPA